MRSANPAGGVRAASAATATTAGRSHGLAPARPGPRIDASDAQAAEYRPVSLRLRVPAEPGRSLAGLLPEAWLLTRSCRTERPVALLIERGIQVKPAGTVAATVRHPREAHPRSPERATASGRGV